VGNSRPPDNHAGDRCEYIIRGANIERWGKKKKKGNIDPLTEMLVNLRANQKVIGLKSWKWCWGVGNGLKKNV